MWRVYTFINGYETPVCEPQATYEDAKKKAEWFQQMGCPKCIIKKVEA